MATCFCGMVHDIGRRGVLAALVATAVAAQAPAQPPPDSPIRN